jgi:hypothetical protein
VYDGGGIFKSETKRISCQHEISVASGLLLLIWIMKKFLVTALSLFCFFLFSAGSCSEKEKKEAVKENPVLKALFEKYRVGQIEECTFNGKTVYHGSINAYDAGSEIYDQDGKSIGVCNYATRMVDAPCEQLTECEAVYRCEKHISGKPAVDKYGLAK